MTTKAKLIVAMLLLGGTVAFINTVLAGWYTRDQAQTNVEQLEAAEAQAAATNADLEEKIAEASGEEKAALEDQLVEIESVDWIDRNDWILMAGWLIVVQFGLLGAAATALSRRDDLLPLTWGEAVFYGLVAFGYLVIVNGFIPHYIIAIWDLRIAATEFTVWPTRQIAELWDQSAIGWQWNWRAVRDMIVAGWYIVTLLATYVVWYWSQEYPKREAQKAATTELTSPYGRPMLSTEK